MLSTGTFPFAQFSEFLAKLFEEEYPDPEVELELIEEVSSVCEKDALTMVDVFSLSEEERDWKFNMFTLSLSMPLPLDCFCPMPVPVLYNSPRA